jgi:MauM/NapG family ferredoxin protein
LRINTLRIVRKIVQLLFLGLFIYLFVATVRDNPTILPVDLFFRMDPLLALVSMLASRQFILALVLGIAAFLAAFVVGRAWCGWVCPLGTILDLVPGRAGRRLSPHWRMVKYGVLGAMVLSAFWGNLTLTILDPVTIAARSLATFLLPALNWAVTGLEIQLYPLEPFQGPLTWIESTFRGNLLAYQAVAYQGRWPILAIFVGVMALNLVASRFWCRYLCPLGALLSLPAQFAWLRRRVEDDCNLCGRCSRVCTMGATDEEIATQPGECILCLRCHANCKQETIAYWGRWSLRGQGGFDISRRQFLAAAGSSVAATALMGAGALAAEDSPEPIRPPGAGEDFLQLCVRCGKCMRICPTSGLQPALWHSGWEGIWSSTLVPRIGHCEYSCNSCGQVCPTGAIPPLELAEKQVQVLGEAHINIDRCLPWARGIPCNVCEEVCPVPTKAIELHPVTITHEEGYDFEILRPHMIHHECIGCGVCERKCPVSGTAAIRVLPLGVEPDFPTSGRGRQRRRGRRS